MQAIPNYISSVIPEPAKNFAWENKESLYLASTVGLAVYTSFSDLNFSMIKNTAAGGVLVSIFLQMVGIAHGRKGIADPQSAPLLSNLIATLNLTAWFHDPKGSLDFALVGLSLKISTAVFQVFQKKSVERKILASLPNFVGRNIASLYYASTVGLLLYTGYTPLDFKTIRDVAAAGILTGCFLQILGVANGKKGIADPQNASRLTHLLATGNLTIWAVNNDGYALTECALYNTTLKITTLVFQGLQKEPAFKGRRHSV